MKGKARLLCAALLIALAPVARAQTAGEVDTQVSTLDTTTANRGQTQVATRIAASFTSLTGGSQDDSLALVNALRNGTPVTLTDTASTTGTTGTGTTGTGTTGTGTTGTGTTGTGTTGTGTTGTTTTTITPPTGKMGWGEVFISLALAKAQLANLGITNPTDAQLQAALTGGSITKADGTAVTVKGVLEMRAGGMGWGQIAQAEGTKLGPVVSSIKSAHTKLAALPATPGGSTTTGIATPVSKSTSTKGITSAAGSSVSGTGSGKGHRGIVTASGSSASLGSGHSSKGITTAAGGSAGGLSTAGVHTTHTSGVVTGAGMSAAGLTTAQGAGGNAGGNGHGRGKGGG